MSARLEVGRIGKAHGLRGEVVLDAVSNRDERFQPGSVLYITDEARTIATARRHQNRWLVRFDGVDDRTAAEALRGALVTGDPLDASDDGVLWVHELVGARVTDRAGTDLGTVTAVEANPAHDLLVTDGGVLIPIVFVVEQAAGRVVVDLPDGLLELYR
ncbi:MAG TPA: ribosome maturation factor RimM [Acidimicrobiia bacterium]|jgi:16S rRNA processing protein RimM|nr:ribosome maturation factor RimM [Acidimicrobiia bacterium]